MNISRGPNLFPLAKPFSANVSLPMPELADEAGVLRIAYQKGEPVLVAAKQLGCLDGPGFRTRWIRSDDGHQVLDALRQGTVSIAIVADTPAILAQAMHADVVYVAAERSNGSAILVPPGSNLQTLRDLKGRRIAFACGSSAHQFTIAALAGVELSHTDITPVYLAPADAAASMMRGDVDAWTIWDPYRAMFELQRGVRTLATVHSGVSQNSFYLAHRRFAAGNPALLARTLAQLSIAASWAGQHRDTVAALISASASVPLAAMQIAMQRNPCCILPITEEIIDRQQEVADRLFTQGLIREEVWVRDAMWLAEW
jgi:sulfonate transport system substrate-binding protein